MRWIGLAVVVALCLALAPLGVEAQAGKVWRIGILQTSAQKDEAGRVAALEQGLAELGYVGGRNIVLVNRNAGQQVGRLPEFATDLVRAGVDVIVTSTNPATLAAKQATATIPIVMTVGVEPVAALEDRRAPARQGLRRAAGRPWTADRPHRSRAARPPSAARRGTGAGIGSGPCHACDSACETRGGLLSGG